MRKYICFCSIILCFFILILTPREIAAETTSVNDCIEQQKDCEQTEEAPTSNSENESEVKTQTDPLWLSMVKLVFALLLVLGLIYLLLRFIKKRNVLFSQVKTLENLGGISLGQNKSIQIIRVGNNYYLIGVGENVELLREITDQSFIDELTRRNSSNSDDGFFSLFHKIGVNGRPHSSKGKESFDGLFAKELDKLKQNRTDLIKQFNKQKEDKHE
ncbi:MULTISPECIES: flagellar biosynthetic protein FliO [Virgibacillus]|uniref:Flagella biosynthesis protein FliZ n=2 Tax=Virgibacillus TaxID=84406 RepID=A0A024QC42_9BACI|nr:MULTISPECIES: flagellar biosynthetic protein FliO [Virgibacillus]EQB36405.1 hypothetical protein M948_15350 [Virgibacillus sp. CM-4]MYL42238.1 flagellar protein [Virgibacillus massiliensis]GGJ44187.1 flagellar biosynthetic protein FliZ [Virgibacillus kapii]CDQ40103.1 flagella biosynthesis protein FliZ [Virgibacillus massiliensis]